MSRLCFVLDANAMARRFFDDIGKRNIDAIFNRTNSTYIVPESHKHFQRELLFLSLPIYFKTIKYPKRFLSNDFLCTFPLFISINFNLLDSFIII
jgi:hypothetical protein